VANGTVAPAKQHSASRPTGEVSAILALNPSCGKVLLEINLKNVKYSFCSTLRLYDGAGSPTALSTFTVGTYARVTRDGTCVSSMQLTDATLTCGSAGFGGTVTVYLVARTLLKMPGPVRTVASVVAPDVADREGVRWPGSADRGHDHAARMVTAGLRPGPRRHRVGRGQAPAAGAG
jgi:hypothetical protein